MKEVDIEVQNNEDGLGYGFENPDAEPLKYRTRAERKAREEKNRKEANIVYENYKEYETEDDIADAYHSQRTLEDKFNYVQTLITRNSLIMTSGNYLTEKERINLGMYPKIFTGDMSVNQQDSPLSQEQINNQSIAENVLLSDIKHQFFMKDKKKHITLDGCREFMEFLGRVSVKPCVNLGLYYDEIKSKLSKEGGSEKTLDYKTKYIMNNGLVKESTFANHTYLNTYDIESKFNTTVKALGTKEFTSGISVNNFLGQDISDHKNDTLNDYMDHLKITDPEVRNEFTSFLGCDGTDSVQGALDKLGQPEFLKQFKGNKTNFFCDRIKKAWSAQGEKQVLKSLTRKEAVAWKRGKDTLDVRYDYKYKKWLQNIGDPLSEKMYRKSFADTFNSMNKTVKAKKSLGIRFGEPKNNITFEEINRLTDVPEDDIVIPDPRKVETKKKYNTYLSEHTGENKISDVNEKNRVMLSKAMAALMLKDGAGNKAYSVSTIHSVAEKIDRTLDLENVQPERIRAALVSPDKVNEFVKERTVELYNTKTNADEAGFCEEMSILSSAMMKSWGRSDDYKTMYKYVKNISQLESYFIKTPEGKSEYLDNIVSLLQATEKYMKGKKSVRSSEDGKERFDNALDVLGVMYKYIPGVRGRIDEIVARVNHVRGAEDVNHKDHVDITKYNSRRASEKAIERYKKESGVSEKDMQNIRIKKI